MKLRSRAITLTGAIIVIYGILQFVGLTEIIYLNQEIIKALFVALLFGLGLFWVLGFKVRGLRLITILGYSSFLLFIQALFLELVVFQHIGRISEKTFSLFILFVFGVLIYFLILTVNILNISYVSQIPLARAAKAANFLYTLFGAYFAFLLLFRSGMEDVVKLTVFIVGMSLLTLNIFWFKKESRRQLVGETGAVVATMLMNYLIFLVWPLSVEVSTMFHIISFYILLGLGLEERETTSLLIRSEYIFLLFVAVFFLLKLAVWGINGAIL